MLPRNQFGYKKSKDKEDKSENPVARLKLLLVSFKIGSIGESLYMAKIRSRRSSPYILSTFVPP